MIPLEYMSRKIQELTVKAGLPRLKLHELRHTNITLLLEGGASLRETSGPFSFSAFRIHPLFFLRKKWERIVFIKARGTATLVKAAES